MYQEDSFKTSQVVYAHTRSDEADMEYKMHCHNSYEIYYMVKGNVEYFLEGTSYIPKPGSLLIIPPSCFHGLRVLDGSANYLLFQAPGTLGDALRQRGIVLRSCGNYPGLDGSWYRTAVRTAPENQQLIEALREVLA